MKKIPAWQLTEVRNKKEVIAKARNEGKTLHFASLMDLCHLKNSELEPQYQKYKGRVVLRGVIVKDDSGSHAVFTEQGSSASQMAAANVMDIKSLQDVQDKQLMASEMGSPRHVTNKWWRTREGPELACVQTPFLSGVARRGRRANKRLAVVPSSRQGW